MLLLISVLTLFFIFTKSIFLQRFKAVLLVVFFFLVGAFLHQLQAPEKPKISTNGKQQILFKLDKKLKSSPKNRKYEIIVWQGNTTYNAILLMPKSEPSLDFNHYYGGETYVNEVKSPLNDYQFNYQKYLQRKGVFYQIYWSGDLDKSKRNDLSFIEKIKENRNELLLKIDSTSISAYSKDFLKGIVLADKTDMDEGITSDFQKSGLVHLLAISGAHIAIIFYFLLFAFRRLLFGNQYVLSVILALVSIWLFAFYIGFGNSVVRACLMLSVYYSYVLLQRKADTLHALSLAALCILTIDTNQVFDVGFQLSFMAVLGIYWLNQPIKNLFKKWRYSKISRFFVGIFSMTLSAQLATLPLVLFYFHQFSLISILSNLIVIPLAEVIIVFSLLITILVGVGINWVWLNKVYDIFISSVLKLIHELAGFDELLMKSVSFNILEVVLAFVVIFLIRALLIDRNAKNIFNFCGALLLFFVLRLGFDFYYFNRNEVVLHKTYSGNILMIKNGNEVSVFMKENLNHENQFKYVIEPYMLSRRLKRYHLEVVPYSVKSIKIAQNSYPLND